MRLCEIFEILGLNGEVSTHKIRLTNLLYVEVAETVRIKGPLGLWPFPILNTLLFNLRTLIKTLER